MMSRYGKNKKSKSSKKGEKRKKGKVLKKYVMSMKGMDEDDNNWE